MNPQDQPKPKLLRSSPFYALSRATVEARLAMMREYVDTKQNKLFDRQSCYLPLDEGLAVFDSPQSIYNRIYHYGANSAFVEELAKAESFYKGKTSSYTAELAPLAQSEVESALKLKRYDLTQQRQLWAIPLDNTPRLSAPPNTPSVALVEPKHHDLWCHILSCSLPTGHEEELAYDTYGSMPSVYRFISYNQNIPVGACCLYLKAETGILFCDGVLPESRGLGMQKKMLLARLKHAQFLGANLVLCETAPDSITAKNLSLLGFQLLANLPLYSRNP